MSFDNSSSFAHWQSSLASGSEKSSQGRPNRAPQSVWGQLNSHAGTRRGLTPLATSNINVNSVVGATRPDTSDSSAPQNANTSPINSSFPSLLTSSRIGSSRQVSSTTSPSPFSPIQTGGQQHRPFSPNQSVISPRSRTITPLSQIVGASASSYSQAGPGAGGGGGTGAGTRSGTYSPSPTVGNITSPSHQGPERLVNPPLSASSTTSGQSSLSKISVAQVLLLVDTISEKEGRTKWESKAEQIRKLVDSNGMEVYSRFIGRLVSRNAPFIFSGAKVSDAGSYQLLQDEMQKVLREPGQAAKIAEGIDSSEGDIFRDFDLSVFIEHFRLDPISKCLLALAFRTSSRSDLRNKAEPYLSEQIPPLLRTIATSVPQERPIDPSIMALLIESLAVSPPRNFEIDRKQELDWAVQRRYQILEKAIPENVVSTLQLLKLPSHHQTITQHLQRLGPKSTATQEAAEDLLASIGLDKLKEIEISNALLFMALSAEGSDFKSANFVAAVWSKSQDKRLNWQDVLRGFDIPNLQISTKSFLSLFNALLLSATEDSEMSLEGLWGGDWQYPETQLSFVQAYICCSSNDIDVSQIPRFRPAFSAEIVAGASEDARRKAQSLLQSHVASLAAMQVVFDLALESEVSKRECEKLIGHLLQSPDYMSVFILSMPNLQPPRTETQRQFIFNSFDVYLQKRSPDYKFVLNGLFNQSPNWTFEASSGVFSADPMKTEVIYEICEELGWTDFFLKFWGSPLALDIVCMRHRESPDFDLEKFLRDVVEDQSKANPGIDEEALTSAFGGTLLKFLKIKADDEIRVQKDQPKRHSVCLALRTVNIFLLVLEDLLKQDIELLAPIQKACLQSYPRLINYGEGFDEILEKSCDEAGHKLPEEVDKKMSDLFGKMYRNELKIREVIELMNTHKTSQRAADQDLFCCVIHGLFDEYSCFFEYPLDALIATAVLFGSIVNFRLISNHALHVGLHLILDAVKNYQPEDLMFKFGVEALEQLRDRLPEWPGYCAGLVQIPTLQGSDISRAATEILRERGQGLRGSADVDHAGLNGVDDQISMTNGAIEDFLANENITRIFKSIRADLPTKGRFQDPEPSAQEKILFVINNTSNDNLTTKVKDLDEVLKDEHFQWFASYLVEQRARLEPNNQEMYARLLDKINNKSLFAEVLRETYICAVKMINAESTLSSATERTHLKNLGGWLGSLTIAKDKPIKHKNIYFTDLLVEGHMSDRLPVVIPFTCKVLVQGARSTVFQPPNPWLMEIIGLLMELYDNVVDLKLNLKFEIEVLCKDIGLDHKKVERTTILQDQTHQFDEELTNVSGQPDGLDMFEDMPLTGMNRAIRQRLSPATVISKLQALASELKYPPASGTGLSQEMIKEIVYHAFEMAIQEIINPVVERSITIASIATAQLISKDFATEPDEEKYRFAAREMVKSLAGNLALVTCKEPLRMSISNYIRRPNNGDLPENLLPEGAILMCVNDNLDLACQLIAESAMENSMAEIDLIIEPDLEDRRRYLVENPDRPYVNRHIPRWATFIPEPFKQTPGGINEVQQAVYDEFDRRLHNVGNMHPQNASVDSNARQMHDVLQDSLALANVSTPAEQPALPHHIAAVHDEARVPAQQQPRMNGYSGTMSVAERLFGLLSSIQEAARSSSASRTRDLEKDSTIFMDARQLLILVRQSTRPPPEMLARQVADKICTLLFQDAKSALEVDVFTGLLGKLCELSEFTNRDIFRWLFIQDEILFANISVTVAFVQHGFIELGRIDGIIWKALQQRKMEALQLLSDVLDHILFNEEPIALRADFAGSLEAMNHWLAEDSSLDLAVAINRKLRANGIPQFVVSALNDKTKAQHDQMRYVFTEWVKLYQSPTIGDRAYASFLKELHLKEIISSREDSAQFVRICIEECMRYFQLEAQSSRPKLSAAFLSADALARLIIMLVKLQGESNGTIKMKKAPYLESFLSLIVLVQNHHQVTRGVEFNQRVFFRLFSAILYEYSSNGLSHSADNKDMMFAFAKTFLALQPAHFPGFVYAWLGLISHRVFIAGLLNMTNEVGWDAYRQLIEVMLQYVTGLLQSLPFSLMVAELYRATVKVMVLLYHDFPDFLSENHYLLCPQIPYSCVQLRNIILMASPPTEQEPYDITQPGFRVERLEEAKKSPVLAGDISAALSRQGLKSIVDNSFRKGADLDSATIQICDGISELQGIAKMELLSSLVLYLATEALNAYGRFDPSSVQTTVFHKLMQSLNEEGRYHLVNAMVDQMRYANNHTIFFMRLVLHLFGMEHVHQQEQAIREQILRVLCERLVTHTAQPWGLRMLFVELEANAPYRVWDLPFVTATPDSRQLMMNAVRSLR